MATNSGFPLFLTDDTYDSPVTRLWFSLDEATAIEIASDDGGAPSDVVTLNYVSPGRDGQAWRAVGGDATYFVVEASLTSDTGPWTNISSGTLADTTPEGNGGTLYIRCVAKRWETAESPVVDFEIRLSYLSVAAIEEA